MGFIDQLNTVELCDFTALFYSETNKHEDLMRLRQPICIRSRLLTASICALNTQESDKHKRNNCVVHIYA